MVNQTCLLCLFVGVMTTVASANAELFFTGSDGEHSGDVLIDWSDADYSIELTVGVRDVSRNGLAGGGLVLVNFYGLTDRLPSNVELSDFEWVFPGAYNSDEWFVFDLPDPEAVSFGPTIEVPVGGEAALARMILTWDGPHTIHHFSIQFTPFTPSIGLADGEFNPLPIVNETHIAHFQAVNFPEPATAGMLLLATALPRRRKIR